MAWLVAGTRDKRYRVDTLDQVTAWVEDEIDTMTQGWIPLTSQREPDGALRVTYGRLPPDRSDAATSLPHVPPPSVAPHEAIWGVGTLIVLVGIAMTFALVARL
jgi:hypothetical protein